MPVDHSKSYKGFGIRAIGHRHRLTAIFQELRNLDILPGNFTFCDIGCSNGYITQMIHLRFRPSESVGFDFDIENINQALSTYPQIRFSKIDLNENLSILETFDLVTCFETLEHVGNLDNAVNNILQIIRPGGKCLITVPIEYGMLGILKYFIKKLIFRYSVSELKISEINYLKILLGVDRISISRPRAESFSTHFGFDCRDIDDLLSGKKVKFSAWNKGFTRFYVINR
jgi:SAM-dependent methyltransferase